MLMGEFIFGLHAAHLKYFNESKHAATCSSKWLFSLCAKLFNILSTRTLQTPVSTMVPHCFF